MADGKIDISYSLSKERSKYRYNPKIRKRLFEENNKCFVCGKEIKEYKNATLEHKIPLSKGGSNRKDNLTVSCRECNFKKGKSLKVRI